MFLSANDALPVKTVDKVNLGSLTTTISPPPPPLLMLRVVRKEMLKSNADLIADEPMLRVARLKDDDPLKAVGEKEGAKLGPE